MKSLNENSTKIFVTLIEKMGREDKLTINAENVLYLTLQRNEQVYVNYQKGTVYTLTFSVNSEGISFEGQEMCFIVVDRRFRDDLRISNVIIYPQSLCLGSFNEFEECLTIVKGTVANINAKLLRKHIEFANDWLYDIQSQDCFDLSK
ncbi:MAG: hypothetical protein P4L51_28630 [Puia sp.]|nr:hypothetical protein [Puia sp.]